jgi:hypothetical protein
MKEDKNNLRAAKIRPTTRYTLLGWETNEEKNSKLNIWKKAPMGKRVTVTASVKGTDSELRSISRRFT